MAKHIVAATAFATALAVCCLAQAPAPQNGSVSGMVTSASGQPLRGATLRLATVTAGRTMILSGMANPSAQSDSQGNFNFSDVPPGRYMLMAERSGYLNSSYATPRSGVLTISSGQQVSGIVIKMSPQGIIAGRVVNEDGEPVVNATVGISKFPEPGDILYRPGVPLTTGRTDADGAFAIGSLLPGRYTVSVEPLAEGSPVFGAPPRQREIYVTTFYPDTHSIEEATPVDLAAGGQARGLEIRIRKVPVFSVSGRVVNGATGQPVASNVLRMIERGSSSPVLSTRSTGINNGAFSFVSVLPGTYVLDTSTAGEEGPRLIGHQVISVGNGDVDQVVVEMKPGIEVRGSVVVESGSLANWPQITLTPTEGGDFPADFINIDSSGNFAVAGLAPAPHRVVIGAIPPPMFVKAIRFNGREAKDGLADLSEAAVGALEIVISDKSSSISGVVTDTAGPVGEEVPVIAQARGGLPYVGLTDASGRFSIKGLPPGEYQVFAIESGNSYRGGVPAFMGKIAKTVMVDEGAAVTADLQLLTLDDLRAATAP